MKKIFLAKWETDVTQNLLGRILRGANIENVSIFFQFNAVNFDADDNKFADAYVASNADFIVSNNNKLLNLNHSVFPPFKVITLKEFSEFLR